MRINRLAVSGAIILVLGTGMTACAAPAIVPKLELASAASGLADAPRGAFTISLAGDAREFVAVADEFRGSQDTAPMSASDVEGLKKLLHSEITVGYDHRGAGTADDRSAVSATIDGVTGTELRLIDGVLYAKAPVKELAHEFGAPPEALAGMESPGAPAGLADAIAGKWVSVDIAALTKQLEESPAGAQARDLTASGQRDKVLASARHLLEGAKIRRAGDDRSHLVATVNGKQAEDEARKLAAALSPSLAAELPAKSKGADARNYSIDLWIKDGKLTTVEFDLVQLIRGKHSGRLALRIELTAGSAITAPQATKLDLPQLGAAFGG